jgi:UDP-glucose 4-epimerase
MKKILITGASGFIGAQLSKYCIDKGDEVHLCDNNSRGTKDEFIESILTNKNSKFIKADLTNRKDLDLLDDSYDIIYHLAAINGTENFYKIPYTVMEVAIKSTFLLLEKFKGKNNKFIFSSSSEVYAGTIKSNPELIPTSENVFCTIDDVENERFSYGGSKLACEIMINSFAKQYGLDYQIIRYHNIYGPRMGTKHVVPQFIKRSKAKPSVYEIYGDTQTRAFCYVDDAVRATYDLSMTKDSGIFHIGNDLEEVEIIKLAKMINQYYDNHVEYDIKNAPIGSVQRRCPNIEKLIKATEYSPKVSLEEGIKKTIEWYDSWFEKSAENELL